MDCEREYCIGRMALNFMCTAVAGRMDEDCECDLNLISQSKMDDGDVANSQSKNSNSQSSCGPRSSVAQRATRGYLYDRVCPCLACENRNRSTHHASRITHHASRITHHASTASTDRFADSRSQYHTFLQLAKDHINLLCCSIRS